MSWSTGGVRAGQVFTVTAADNGRIGHCWMAGRLRDGDLVMAVQHSGDGFWDYVLLDRGFLMSRGAGRSTAQGTQAILNSRFGAYVLGERTNIVVGMTEFNQLMEGQKLVLEADVAVQEVMES